MTRRLRVLLLALVGAVLVSLAWSPGAADEVGGAGISFAVVGDSITNANSTDLTRLAVGDRSWVRHVAPGLRFAGGWAHGGARTADMVAGAQPVTADVLVVIAGTNDLAHGIPFDATARHLVTIAATVGAGHVVVSAIPPRDSAPGVAERFNRRLATFVAARGWTFVDAMADLRDGDRYAPGMSDDGLHPSRAGTARIAAALSGVIARVGAAGVCVPSGGDLVPCLP